MRATLAFKQFLTDH